MDESAPMRAIMIGVSVFIAIATITAVLSYYNTSKDLVRAIGPGTDIGQEYANYVQDILLKTGNNTVVTGTEVKNLLNYFYKKENVNITVRYLNQESSFPAGNTALDKITVSNVNNNETEYNKLQQQLVSTQKFQMTKKDNGMGNLEINLTCII